MRGLRVVVVGAMVLGALALASAATAADNNSASTSGVTPTFIDTGGQSNDCVLFGINITTDQTQFRIANPQTLSYSGQLLDGTQFKVSLKIATNGPKKDKFFDFTLTDANGGPSPALATNVGVKGGTQTARYNYSSFANGGVAADGALHATLDNQGNLYNLSNVTFCLKKGPSTTITASTFEDAANNGIFDGADSALTSWRVFIDANANSTFDPGEVSGLTSGAGGSYQFAVAPGSAYRICEVLQSGWFNSTPLCRTTASLGAGSSTSLSYGNYRNATVTAGTYWDKGGDGSFNGTDAVQVGWTVFIDSSGDGLFTPGEPTGSTAGVTGTYQFSVTPGFAYKVCEVVQSGWLASTPTCRTTATLLSGAAASPSPSFGNYQTATISGRVFGDDNANGTFNSPPESGLSTTVNVYATGSSLVIASATTNPDGSYTVTDPDLKTGLSYTVCAVAPTGSFSWLQTLPAPGGPACGLAEFSVGAQVSLVGNATGIDFAAQKRASISGTVFNDANNNGVNDSGEPAAGWVVRLYSGGSFISTTTDANGGYAFLDKPAAGSYTVCVVPPAATGTWTQKAPTGGLDTGPCNGPGELGVGYLYAPLGSNKTGVANFGAVVLADVSGTVFYDTSGNGIQDNGESGLSAWSVRIYTAAGALKATTASGATGTYLIQGLPVGDYRICVVPAAGKWRQTAPPAGTQCGAGELPRGAAFTLTGTGKTGVNFGNVQIADISGTIFVDSTDHNGNFDRQRTGNEGLYTSGPAVVNLYTGAGALVESQTTNDGTFSFASKDSGSYVVCLGTLNGFGEALPTAGNPQDQANYPATPNSTACAPAGNFSQAYGVTLGAANVAGLQFGIVVGTTNCVPPFPAERYEVRLAGNICKEGQIFTSSYDDTGNKLAVLTPVRNDLPLVPMLEKITWSIPTDNRRQLTVIYDDIVPFGDHPRPMRYCLLDPRDPAGPGHDGLDLLLAYQPYATSSSILPPPDAPGDDPQTSCLIEVQGSVAAPSGGKSDYVFYIYSSVDGWRTTP